MRRVPDLDRGGGGFQGALAPPPPPSLISMQNPKACEIDVLAQQLNKPGCSAALIQLIEHLKHIKCVDENVQQMVIQWMNIQFWQNLMLLGNGGLTDSCANHYGGNIWALLLHRLFMGSLLVAVFAFFMALCFKVVHDMVAMIKAMLTESCKGVYQLMIMTQAMLTELWRAFVTFADVIHGALSEIWRNCTRDNLSSLIATGIILYVFPEVYSILMELLRKNVVLWASGSKLKG